MTLQPLLAATPAIQLHAAAALTAFVLGAAQLALPKGGARHRVIGWVWVAAMLIVAISSFWISSMPVWGPYGPIHLLSVMVLAQLPLAVHAARNGNVARHRGFMLGLFFGALVIAGLFTLLPSRIMGRVLFGG